jgi:hypothetical protein
LFDACGVDVGVLLFIDEVNFFDLVCFNLAKILLSFYLEQPFVMTYSFLFKSFKSHDPNLHKLGFQASMSLCLVICGPFFRKFLSSSICHDMNLNYV